MKISDIVNQLFRALPKYTNYFTDNIAINQITSSALIATVETSTPHGLNTNDYVHISEALTPNPLTSLKRIDNIAYGVTTNDHDLTQNFPPQEYIEIAGADQSEYNGTHKFLLEPNRRNFSYEISGTPVTPATGSPELLENLIYGYNGWHQITVIDSSNFTYTLPKAQSSPAKGNPICQKVPRISGTITAERADAAYTKKPAGKLWAFVVIGNKIANKDRQMTNDSTYAPGKGSDYRQLVIQPFSIYIFVPASSTIAGRQARDLCTDLEPKFCKALLRYTFPSQFAQENYSGVVFSASNFMQYNPAYYVHELVFETTQYITYEDTIDDSIGVAFRDIDIDYLSVFSDNVIMTDSINLDNEPL
jgi:hypothetical protein